MKQQLKAILFDFDGTLVNSEELHFNALNDLLVPYEIEYTWEEYAETMAGKPSIHTLEQIIEEHQLEVSLSELLAKKEALSYENLRKSEVVFMPKAKEMLDYYREKELTLALVTGSDREMVTIIFEKTDLALYFKITVTATDVKETKPHPESYLKALKDLNLKHEDCIAIEDTVSGMTSAKDAGLTCLVVQHDTTQHVRLKRADAIFKNLNEARAYIEETYTF